MASGKEIRLKRIFNQNSKKTIIVPMDHGVSVGPIPGLEKMRETIKKIAKGGAEAILVHKGIAKNCFEGETSLIIHLSGATVASEVNNKVLVASVEEAISLGADAVSVHVNIGAPTEPQMLSDLGQIAEICENWGMPLLAMMYPRGPRIDSEHNPKWVKMVARIGAELGADIVKTNYTGSVESFKEVIEGCPVPVVIAGGPKVKSEEEFLEMVEKAIEAGAKGVSIGRNVFQAKDPEKMVRALTKIVHEGKSAKEALEELK